MSRGDPAETPVENEHATVFRMINSKRGAVLLQEVVSAGVRRRELCRGGAYSGSLQAPEHPLGRRLCTLQARSYLLWR